MKAVLLIMMIFSTAIFASDTYSKKDIMGVWKLTKFVIKSKDGSETRWCKGSTGTIAYLPGLMSVSINCEEVEKGSGADKIGGHLFYSGPYEVDTATNEVVHRVRNYSHSSLNKVYRRTIEMDNVDHLKLVGFLGEGKQAIVEWERIESFSYDSTAITGEWELVGSENKVEGSDRSIPFCTGFYGTILYTPGGYTAVSINCGDKINSSDIEPADEFGRNFFYAGTYQVSKHEVTHKLDNASELFLIGENVKREMKIEKDILTLRGVNGSEFIAEWRKVRSFTGF